MTRGIALIAFMSIATQAYGQDTVSTLTEKIKRLEAQIQKDYEQYKKRPKTLFIPNPRKTSYIGAEYLGTCITKIEETGNTYYPEEAKNKLYGNLLVYFEILPNGDVRGIRIERSSGSAVLDGAAIRTIEMASPFDQFPTPLKDFADIIATKQIFTYTRGNETARRFYASNP